MHAPREETTMNRIAAASFLAAAAFLPACADPHPVQPQQSQATPAAAPTESQPQLFRGMGSFHRPVATKSDLAQKYFDQGLTFAFAFNHDEAIRSFQEAARLDPQLAAPWWGIALCNGPHINNPAMDEEHSKAAWEALQKARSLAGDASSQLKALIDALAARYADPSKGKPPEDPVARAPFDKAYAQAMAKVHKDYPTDVDISVLYAESLMDLRPWDLWDRDGTPRPEMPEILSVLESVLAVMPNHPGANHLYIHSVEASPHPEKGIASAERLKTLVPSAGHLVHMPAHIWARVGRWEDAAAANRQAIAADAAYRKLSPTQGFYHIYMAHNRQFLAFGCMMQGRSEEAIASAVAMREQIPDEFIQAMAPVIDGALPLKLEVLTRFGRWEEILSEPKPADNLPIMNAIWHGERAIAYANTGRMKEALTERQAFHDSAKAVPEDRMVINNPASKVLTIAGHVVDGEIAFKQGSIDEAVNHLKEAVQVEDTLKYDEPPDWMLPARHTLGAVLLSVGRAQEAEQIYREDLKHWPENGWSLFGLSQALRKQDSPDATAVEERFKKAWAGADIKIGSSCMCVKGE
jgi:tetratricopeptide (TPR) repeat protein